MHCTRASGRRSARRAWGLGLLLVLLGAVPAPGAVLNVPGDYATIQEAVNAAVAGDEVVIAPGTYNGRVMFDGKAITIRSTNPDDPAIVATTILDGEAKQRVIYFVEDEGPDSVLTGLTIRNGSTGFVGAPGAGIYCLYSSPTISKNVISANVAGDEHASSGRGGGIYTEHGAPTITQNTFIGNSACADGGAISCECASPVISANTFINNTARSFGGGAIFSHLGPPVITGNIFVGNESGGRGGTLLCMTSVTIANNTFWGSRGGAINAAGGATIRNSIVCGSVSGGGISEHATLHYCNVYGNTGGNYVNMSDQTGLNGNISADPLFADAANGDLHLKSTAGRWSPSLGAWVTDLLTSLCIDGGDPTWAFDLEPAPNGGRINMGAYGNTAEASKLGNRQPTEPDKPTISPTNPTTLTDLVCSDGTGSVDVDHDEITYEYQWDRSWAGTWAYAGQTLDHAQTAKGYSWRVRVRAVAGGLVSFWVESDAVKIGDAAPSDPDKPTISPAYPTTTDDLVCSVGSGSIDPDGDTIVYWYLWERESTGLYDLESRTLPSTDTTTGETWRVSVCAYARGLTSAWVASDWVTIANVAPTRPTSLVITPSEPAGDEALVAEAGGSRDLNTGDTVSYQYQWNKSADGGATWPYAGSGPKIPASRTTRGEQWRVRARATDGTAQSEWRYSAPVTIGNTPPTRPTSVTISPTAPQTVHALWATATGSTDLDSGDAPVYQYQWNKSTDGGVTWAWGGGGRKVPAANTAVGEQWRVRARATDGTATSEWRYSTPVTIGNTPPPRPTSVTISPAEPTVANDLSAEAIGSVDPDVGDTVSYQYQWNKSVNGGATWAYAGCGPTVPAAKTTAGELWRVRARASDGAATSEWRYSAPVTIGGVWESQIATVTAVAAPTQGGAVPITVHLSAAATVQVTVVNIAGRTVVVLPECALVRGSSTLLWNGRSTSGTGVPTGSYFVNVTARMADGRQSRTCAPLRLTR